MRKLLAIAPLLFVLTSGCDSGRRNFNYCDTTYSQCGYRHTCDFDAGLCVADVDGGIEQDTSVIEASAR
jgi:hypothetical protein